MEQMETIMTGLGFIEVMEKNIETTLTGHLGPTYHKDPFLRSS